jgi:hypothetical protein
MKLPSPDQVLGNKNTLPSPSDVLGTVKKKVASKPRSQEELWGSESQPQDLYTSLVTGAQEPQQESDGLGGPPKKSGADNRISQSLSKINKGLMNDTEENVVAQLSKDQTFKNLGFSFEESGWSGDYVTVTAPNKKTKEISLDNFLDSKSAAQSVELQNFIKQNTTKEKRAELEQISQIEDSNIQKLQSEKKKFGQEFDLGLAKGFDKKNSKYLNDKLQTVNSKLINQNEEYVVPQMNYQFGDLGFKFEESGATGDWMIATAPNGKKMEISLDPLMSSKAVSESAKLQQFIRDNTPNKGLYVIEKTASDENQKINSQKDVDTSIKRISDEANSLNTELKAFLSRKNALETTFEKGSEGYNQLQAQLITERDALIQKQSNLKTKEVLLKKSVGKYTSMKSEQGTWLAGTWNALMDASASGTAGFVDMMIDIGAEITPNEMMMSPKDLKNSSLGISKKLGIKPPSVSQTYAQWKESLTEDQKDSVEDEMDDIIKKSMKKDAIPIIRKGNREVFGSSTATPEWDQLKSEGFWGGAYLGLVKTAPALIGGSGPAGWAQRTAQMYALVSDGIRQEMDKNPEFDNVSENQKLAVVLPVGITGAILEEFGLKNIKGSTGLINKIAMSALGKAGTRTTAKTFRELVENEVESGLARGLLTIGSAGLAEFESGALQTATELGIKEIYNQVTDKKMFETPETIGEWVNDIAIAGAQEAVGGFVLGMPTAISAAYSEKGFLKMSDDNFRIFEAAANDDNIQKAFITNLKTQITQGIITTAEAKEQLNNYRNSVGLFKSLPEGLNTQQKKEAMNLLKEKRDLQNQVDGKDPSLVKKLTDRITAIDASLISISESTVTDENAAEAVEEITPAVEEPAVKPSGQKVTDVINRPATLESQAGVKLETPIDGDVYQEGQRVIFEDKNKKVYDLGNIDEISDKTVEELGIKPQEEMVSVTPEGKVKVGENEWNMQSELPNYGIEYDSDGNVKAVSLKDDAGKTVMYEGQVAEDAAYQVLLKQTETPEQRQAINEILENDEELNRQLREAEEAAKAAAVEVTEPGAPKTQAEQYSEELDKTKESDPEAYWSVSPVSAADAAKGTIIDTPDGAAIVKPDGDIAGLFKKATSKAKGVAQDLLKRAVAAGGKKLDNFDGYLTKQYEKAGFRIVSRVPFNEEYAPPGWNKEIHGTPDVVAMVYDPEGKLDIEEKTFDDYDEAMAYRDSLLEPSIDVELEGLAKLFDESDKGFRISQVDKAKEALKRILPGVEFIVHETNEAYKKATGESGSGGMYIYRPKTDKKPASRVIHINKQKANGRTVAHEVFHAVILDKIKGDKAVQEITARMVDAVYKTASPELRAELDAFAARYTDKTIRDEERLAELIGIIADGYPKMSQINKGIVKRWLEALAKMFGRKPFTDNEVIDLLNTLAGKISTGEVISEEDVKIIKPTKVDSKGNLPEPTEKSKNNLKAKRSQLTDDTKSKVKIGSIVSTRTPDTEGIHKTSDSIVDLKSLEKDDALVIKIAKELSSYGLSKIEEVNNINDARNLIQDFKKSVKDNLRFLHDSFGKEVRDVAKLWYDGANKISNEIADKYDYSTDQVAGVMAVLSPQMDWFRNLSLGKRVIDIYKNQQDTLFDSKMKSWVENSSSGTGKNKKPLLPDSKDIIKRVDGKKLSELDIKDKAIFIRAYDEMYNSKNYENISPNGEINGLVRNKNGSPGACGWGAFPTIEKSISILEDGSIENISKNLGNMHKVRNFFNNISNPNDPNAVTIDTHAVAAGLLLPLSGSSKEVLYNFGGASSKSTGSKGSYAVYADAYRELAKELKILPRELQSITWEAVRGLFKADFKANKSNEENVKKVWSKYKNGEISIDKAHSDINDLAGGISKPVWYEYVADDNVKSLDENSAAMDQANEDLSEPTTIKRSQLTDDGVTINAKSNTSYTVTDNGNVVGSMQLTSNKELGKGYLSVDLSKLNEKYIGKGIGLELYRTVANKLKDKGIVLTSSMFRNEKSDRVWKSLEKSGEAVEIYSDPKLKRTVYALVNPEVRRSQKVEWEESKLGKGDKAITDRQPVLQNAAERYANKEISYEEYLKIKDVTSPIKPITDFIEPAKEEDIRFAVGINAEGKTNLKFDKGTLLGLRLDINAYINKNIWAITIHAPGKGKVLSYNNVARLKNVTFGSNAKDALNIARHKINKATIARMHGEWIPIEGNTSEEKGKSAMKFVESIVNNPEWSQVGMNPFRHSWFYDRADGKPVLAADELIQIGGLVYAKNVVKTTPYDKAFEFLDQEGDVMRFQEAKGIDEIVRIAKEAKYSDAAISAFLKAKGFSDAEITSALATDRPSVNKIYEDSKKAIDDKKRRVSIKDLAPFLRKSLLDRQAYIKRVINRIDNKSAKKAYDLLVTKAGASALASERFKRAEKKIYGGLSSEDVSTLDKIIYAKRMVAVNESRAKLGLEPYKGMDGYSIDDANRDLADFKNSLGDKKFNDLSNRATEYFDVFKLNLKKLYESGRISEETYESLKDTEYSPIKTIKYIIGDNLSVDEIDTQAKSLGISRNDIMKLSDNNENEIILDSKWLLAMSINSVEGRAFENNMLREFDKAIKEATPEEKKAFEDIILDNPVVGTKKDGGLKYKYDDTRLPVGYTKVSYFNDGNKVEIVLKDQYAKQLLDVKNKNKALETLGKLTGTKILRFFATGGNPLFIIGNTAVDFQNIAFFSDVYSKFKPMATAQLARDYTKNFVKKLFVSNEYNKIFNEYINHGGALDYMASDGLRSLESMNPVKGVTKAVQKGLIAYGRAMSLLGETSEVAFRLSVFQKVKEDSIKEFKKENNREPNAQELDDIMWNAGRQSRETMDFSQGGDVAKNIDAVFPYFNAALQGIRRPIDFAKKDPVGFSSSVLQYTVMASSLAAGSFAMLINAVGGDDDEDRTKKIMDAMNSLSEYEKANYHIMFTGEKNKDGEYEYYRVKKLPVLSVISTVAEQLIYKEFFNSKGIDYDMDSKVMLEAVNKSNPLPVTVQEVAGKNPVASGLVSYWANKDTFTGDKIFREPDNKKILPEAEGMFDDRVDQIYKDLAPGFGLSPARTKVMVEKVITSANTNPTIPLIYSAYDGLFNKSDGLGSEVKEAMSGVGDAFGKKVVRYTDKKIIRYKDQDEKEYQESVLETKVWNSEQKVYNEIKKKYDGGGNLTNKELIDLVKENFEPMDYRKYAKKYNAYIHNMNIDKSVLDIIFEDVPEVQAMKLNQRYGPNLEGEELKELGRAMNSAGKRINNKSIYIYNKKYKNRKNAQ